jgi:hypothetical protein
LGDGKLNQRSSWKWRGFEVNLVGLKTCRLDGRFVDLAEELSEDLIED